MLNKFATILRIWLCTLILFSGSQHLSAQEQRQLTDQEKLADLAILWSEAKYNFVYFDLQPGLDWDATFEAYIPKVLATNSNMDYIRVLQEFYALLKEGHSNVVPLNEIRKLYGINPPVELDVIEGEAIVINAAEELIKELPIGSRILEVDGIPSKERLQSEVFPFISAATEHDKLRKAIQGGGEQAVGLLTGPIDTEIDIRIELPDGNQKELTIRRTPEEDIKSWINPPKNEKTLFEFQWLEGEIALLEVNGLFNESVVVDFMKSLPELKKAKGIIIDSRKNQGGSSSLGFEICSHFTEEKLVPVIWKTRKHISAYKAWGRYGSMAQYRPYYELRGWTPPDTITVEPSVDNKILQPVVALSGSDAYSAGEDFLACLDQIPELVIVGSASAGSTGQPLILSLKTVYAAITAKRDMLPDSNLIVGKGIQPDKEVHQTVAAFREGRDLVLEEAIQVLKSKIKR